MNAEYNLTPSPVVFVENPHGYWLGEQQLSGVTQLIKNVLHLGDYPDASDYVRNVAIPRAGERGTAVHRTIQIYDDLGIRQTEHAGRFGTWETSRELDNYLKHREGFVNVANEYTVSDNLRYASQIDNIWAKADNGEIWLVDTKTNNLAYFPGGKESLKQYLQWQLSIYAFMFERQNPLLKVANIAANWLREDEAEFWVLDRIPDEQVAYLLTADWAIDERGEFSYYLEHPEMLWVEPSPDGQLVPAMPYPIIGADIARTIYNVEVAKKEAEEISKTMKAALQKAMRDNNVSKWDCSLFKVTLSEDTVTRKFDLDRFLADHPDIDPEPYYKESKRSGSMRITIKESEIV